MLSNFRRNNKVTITNQTILYKICFKQLNFRIGKVSASREFANVELGLMTVYGMYIRIQEPVLHFKNKKSANSYKNQLCLIITTPKIKT